MQDFPSASNKAKARSEQQPEKIERVTSAEAVRRKKGVGRQFKETFIGGSARTAAEYMVSEVIVPAVRDMLRDALQGGIDKLIYGDTRAKRGAPSSSYPNLGRVNYQGVSNPTQASKPPGQRTLSRRSASHEIDDLVIENRQEAEDVIDRMFDILSRYGTVTVANLHDMTGIPISHIDHKWGWTELRGAKVSRLRSGGFLLDLPEPEPLG